MVILYMIACSDRLSVCYLSKNQKKLTEGEERICGDGLFLTGIKKDSQSCL